MSHLATVADRWDYPIRMPDRPPLWAVFGTLAGASLFIGGVLVYLPWALSGWRVREAFFGWESWRWIGGALIALSVPVLLDFLMRFVREGHGTPVPIAPPRHLVVRGAFRYVRNPAYLGAVANLLGQSLVFGSPAVLTYALIMAAFFHLFVVMYEEPTLRQKFGAEYEAYCQQVGRWLPRRPRR